MPDWLAYAGKTYKAGKKVKPFVSKETSRHESKLARERVNKFSAKAQAHLEKTKQAYGGLYARLKGK